MAFYENAADDTDRLMSDPRARAIATQLIEAAGSVCADFEEGYGRGTPAEFSHRLRKATGEAREARGWYYRARKFLPADLIAQRAGQADEGIALLSSMIKSMGGGRTPLAQPRQGRGARGRRPPRPMIFDL